MNRSTIIGIAAAAAASTPIFFSSSAQAACLNSNCTIFDGSTDSVLTAVSPFTGTATVTGGGGPFQQFSLGFLATGFTSPSVVIKDIVITSPVLAAPPAGNYTSPLTLANGVTTHIGFPFLQTAIGTIGATFDFSTVVISYTIEGNAGAPVGASISVRAGIYDSPGQISAPFVQTAGALVPGPVPILGASVAFGFSRNLRRRIKRAA